MKTMPPPETLTLRDQLAMAALQGLLAEGSCHEDLETYREVADCAYDYADAMLAARKQPQRYRHE